MLAWHQPAASGRAFGLGKLLMVKTCHGDAYEHTNSTPNPISAFGDIHNVWECIDMQTWSKVSLRKSMRSVSLVVITMGKETHFANDYHTSKDDQIEIELHMLNLIGLFNQKQLVKLQPFRSCALKATTRIEWNIIYSHSSLPLSKIRKKRERERETEVDLAVKLITEFDFYYMSAQILTHCSIQGVFSCRKVCFVFQTLALFTVFC